MLSLNFQQVRRGSAYLFVTPCVNNSILKLVVCLLLGHRRSPICSDLINKKDVGMSLEELLILLLWNVNCIWGWTLFFRLLN